jgi:putative transposase
MTDNPIKITRQRLPHWEKDGATYFITICTWDKLELNPPARKIVLDAFLYFHQNRYELYILVVMPDHLHCLIKPYLKEEKEYWSLPKIMHSLKSYTAKKIPSVMNHIGTIWQPERYDRIVRNKEEFNKFWEYIYNNPVKANLVTEANDYPFLWYIF